MRVFRIGCRGWLSAPSRHDVERFEFGPVGDDAAFVALAFVYAFVAAPHFEHDSLALALGLPEVKQILNKTMGTHA